MPIGDIIVDVEVDDPIPGGYSMSSFGAIAVELLLSKICYSQI
jgi:hypothetical protein